MKTTFTHAKMLLPGHRVGEGDIVVEDGRFVRLDLDGSSPRDGLTVDCAGKLALPGGFANENEPVEQTAARELEEETGVAGLQLKLVDIFSKPDRDPRGWVVSAAFVSVVDAGLLNVQAGDDAAEADWYDVALEDGLKLSYNGENIALSELAFDHEEVLVKALNTI